MSLLLKPSRAFGRFTDMSPVELPDFAILTGLNGSGKTQLLRAIENGSVTVEEDGAVIPTASALYVSNLTPKLNLKFTAASAVQHENELVNILRNAKGLGPRRHRFMMRQGAGGVSNLPPAHAPQLERVGAILGKKVSELLDEEVEAYAVAVRAAESSSHFTSDIAAVSMGHLRTYYHQMTARRVHNVGDSSLDALLDESRSLVGVTPPWVLISEVLGAFGFTIEGPTVSLESAQRNLDLVMLDANGVSTEPGHLSGGEQSLLALALAQYATAAGGRFPRLLLLDECLSTLHPSIIATALRVIAEVFVAQNKTRVILVTHAPTVIALAPRESIFVAEKQAATRLTVRLASADEGIGLLTVGVPSLRIDLENSYQVFVEADVDQWVYARLYDALRSLLPAEKSLAFLSCGRKGDSSRERVIDLVRRLRTAGNNRIRGIVDGDGKDTAGLPHGVQASCRGERDALENLVLDPAMLAFILATTEDGRQVIGGRTYTDLLRMDDSSFEGVVGAVVASIGTQRCGASASDETRSVPYTGGRVIRMPAWVLSTDGHQYAGWVLGAFPFLRRLSAGTFGSAEDKLLAAIASDRAPDLRDYVPRALLEMFERLLSRDSSDGG
jgi:ABC-type molybdenum transport system ATPase subunit/photorepair protein PhrA